MVNSKNFFISGFIAISFYIMFALLLLLYIKKDPIKKIDALKKATVLQLDIIVDTPKEEPKQIDMHTKVQQKDEGKEVIKKTTSTSIKQKTDLKSLFANVKLSASKVTKQTVSTVKKSTLSSRFKSKFEQKRKVKKIISPKLINNKNTHTQKVVMGNNNNSDDPYYSKINQILSTRWNPTIFAKNLIAKVSVIITNNGIFRFNFIQYSENAEFNNQLLGFLKMESLKKYPIHPSHKTKVIEITFKSEE